MCYYVKVEVNVGKCLKFPHFSSYLAISSQPLVWQAIELYHENQRIQESLQDTSYVLLH